MTLKKKLLVTISMMALTIVMLMVGVWALKSTNFTVGGNINFTAKGVQATISKGVLSDTGSFDPSVTGDKMPQVKINTSHTQDQIDTMFEDWQGLHLLFNEDGDDVTITFSITNDASYTDKLLAVTVTTTTGTLNNATVALNKNSARIASGKSQEFVITFKVTEKTLNASVPSFSINFNLELVDMVTTDESQVSYLTFDYDHDNLTASVTGCAAGTATAEIPEYIRHTYTNNSGQEVTAVYTVTSIADGTSLTTGAFYATRSTLTSVTLPSTLTKIGYYAFYNCYSLTSVSIPDSVTSIGDRVFQSCTTLTSATIGNSVKSIGSLAFNGCSSLTSVTIGKVVAQIGQSAFNGCSSLTEVNYLGDINSWVQIEFSTITDATSNPIYYSNSLKINGVEVTSAVIDTATTINAYAFSSYTKLTSVTIGNQVTSIGYQAFSGCSGLTEVNYLGDINSWVQIDFDSYNSNPTYYSKSLKINGVEVTNAVIDTATTINSYVFYNCTGLTSVSIPDSVTSIGRYAFSGCSNLATVVITKETPPTLGSGVFADALIGIYVPNTTIQTAYKSATNWSDYADKIFVEGSSSEDIYDFTANGGHPYLTFSEPNTTNKTISITDCVSNITEIIIPSQVIISGVTYDVTSIDEWAFGGNGDIKTVKMPKYLTSIGLNAFRDCCNLESITIPSGVTSIGGNSFKGCTSLTTVFIDSPTIAKNAVSYTNDLGSSLFNNTTEVYILTTITDVSSSFSKVDDTEYNGYYKYEEYITDSSAFDGPV